MLLIGSGDVTPIDDTTPTVEAAVCTGAMVGVSCLRFLFVV